MSELFVDLNVWTLIFQLCNLLILALLMKKFLFKPVQSILDKRKEEIAGIYAEADADRNSAEQLKAEYTQKMSNARAEADRMVRDAQTAASQKSDEIIESAQKSAAYMKRKAEEDIEAQRRQAFDSLKGDISGMAVSIAEKMVGREINAKDQEALVEDFIRNAGDDK